MIRSYANWPAYMLVFAFFSSCSKDDSPQSANAPSVISFTPGIGNTGDQVTITGNNFSTTVPNNIVSFNGGTATVVNASATQLTVIVPATAFTGKIYVTVNGQTGVSASDFTKAGSTSAPVIVSFTPTGSIGDTIVIKGTNFSTTPSSNIISFNGVAATVVTATNTELTVIVPLATTGKLTLNVSGNSTTTGTNFIKLGTVSTFTGGTFGLVDGPATTAQFRYPASITIDGSGNFYIVDSYAADDKFYIRKVSSSGSVNTIATLTGMTWAFGIAVDKSGNIYTADNYHHSIKKITPTGIVTTFAGLGAPSLPGFTDGIGTTAKFNDPRDVAIDKLGNIYVADAGNSSIRKITPAGVVSTFANGNSTPLLSPSKITIDSSGNLYVADYGRILKVTSTGIVTVVAGGNIGFLDGVGTGAMFAFAQGGIAVDAQGNIFVSDNGRIREINIANLVFTAAGTAVQGYVNGRASKAQFYYPGGIAIDALGNVFITDSENHVIRKLIP